MPDPTPNKIKFGLRKLAYAPITAETDAGVITYGSPVLFPGAISISLQAQGERRPLSADDSTYFEAWSNGGYEGDITVALIPDHFQKACLGVKTDAATGSNVLYETTEIISQRFALLGEFQGDKQNTRWAFLNCTASRPQFASQTVDGEAGLDPSQSTETFTISAKGRRADQICKVWCENDNSETYNGWYEGVYVPTVASS